LNKYFNLAVDTTGRSADIYIFGDIVAWEWFESDVSSYTLSRAIAGLDVDTINVHISSYGGDVSEGLAIFNVLRNHKATVKTICDGFACSAASVVFMAGKERVMNAASLLMIHNAWTHASGNADDFRKQAEDLDKIGTAIKAAYLGKISITEADLDTLLKNESWIVPTEALEWGFATSVIADAVAEPGKAAASARKAVYQLISASRQTKPIDPKPAPPKTVSAEDKLIKYLNAFSVGGHISD
jgi:Protease subunit of ATP-dependent Clp proteases